MSSTRSSSAGFTLVELTVVIIIVAVLGSIAMPRFFDDRRFAERGFYEELAAAIRYAQKAAIASGCPVRVVITPGGYQASQQQAAGGRCDPADMSWSTPVRLADGESLQGVAPSGVGVAPPLSWIFDTLGRTTLGADQVITVGPYTMTLEAASGYVVTT